MYNDQGYFLQNITKTDDKEKPVGTMREQRPPVKARVKLTLCGKDKFFGPGVCELLEGIRETGSIQAAAAQMGMSYSKAWKILKRAEEEMGEALITRVSGGKNGGSSTLTETGERAVRVFREMEEKLDACAGELIKEWNDKGAFQPLS